VIIELENTTASQIGQRILTARGRVGVPTGLVFTMIVVAEQCDTDAVIAASIDAGQEHPSRILVISDGDGPTRLDARLRVGGEVPGEIGPGRLVEGEGRQRQGGGELPDATRPVEDPGVVHPPGQEGRLDLLDRPLLPQDLAERPGHGVLEALGAHGLLGLVSARRFLGHLLGHGQG